MMKAPAKSFVLCIDNSDYQASLILGKVYRILPDPRAAKMIWCASSMRAARIICITKTTLYLWISHRPSRKRSWHCKVPPKLGRSQRPETDLACRIKKSGLADFDDSNIAAARRP